MDIKTSCLVTIILNVRLLWKSILLVNLHSATSENSNISQIIQEEVILIVAKCLVVDVPCSGPPTTVTRPEIVEAAGQLDCSKHNVPQQNIQQFA